MTSDPDDPIRRMVEIAAGQEISVSNEEVSGFPRAMNDDEEFDDIELDAVALSAIAGGARGEGGPC